MTTSNFRTERQGKRVALKALVLTALVGTPAYLAVHAASATPTPPGGGGGPVVTTMYMPGVFRDFRNANVHNGHPDFQVTPTQGRGIYIGMVQDQLGADGLPVYASTGYKVTQQASDRNNRPICPAKPYINSMGGDHNVQAASIQGGACQDYESFHSWYRDVQNVNTSAMFALPMTRVNNMWTWDGDLETQHASVSGFGGNKPYGYTYYLATNFIYHRNQGQTIEVGADDCLWVFIDGKLVADLGGSHTTAYQFIDLDRLNWLTDGRRYDLKFFYCERFKQGSWLKIGTTFEINSVDAPAVSGLFD